MYRHVTSAPSPDVHERLQEALGAAYAIERELGGGGMSRIFLAREVALGRRVVVKLLPPEYAAGVNGERFHHEILLAARLQHPHIVPILTAGEMNGVPYYTMPFIDGESLRWRLLRGDRFGAVEVTRVLHDVIDALAYAHEHGVVHRDIKPDNVLMSRQHALITDFGVAKALCVAHESGCDGCGVETENGLAIGTPAYMAPEQAAADPSTDHRADLYGFGVLAYELLTGQPPFSGREPLELLAAHVAESPIPILAMRPEVPEALADLVMRCLEKQPEMRPASAAEVRDALELMSTSFETVPIGPRTPRFAERVSRVAAAITLAVLGAGGALLHLGGERAAVVADASEAHGVAAAERSRPPVQGPGLLDAHWVGARRRDVELPAVTVAEPDQKALAAKGDGSRSKSLTRVPRRAQKLASGGSAGTTPDREEVRVVLQSTHGTADIVVSSLEKERAKLEITARRLQLLEAMVSASGPVVTALPAIDSITHERSGGQTRATVFVRDGHAPPAPQPRKQAPDGAASASEASTPSAPDASAAAPAPAPAPARVIGLVELDEAIARVRTQLAPLTECPDAAAKRLRDQASRAKGRGATS